LSLTLLAFASGCGGSSTAPKVAHVKAGDMPVGGEWTGVYYSQLQGYLHLMNEGNSIQGRWRITAGEKFGEMAGEVTGDVFRYEWTERTIGMVGPLLRAAAGATSLHDSEGRRGARDRWRARPRSGRDRRALEGREADEPGADFKKVTPDETEDRPTPAAETGTMAARRKRARATRKAEMRRKTKVLSLDAWRSSARDSVSRTTDFRARRAGPHRGVAARARRAESRAFAGVG
jgi:hypothetical protein